MTASWYYLLLHLVQCMMLAIEIHMTLELFAIGSFRVVIWMLISTWFEIWFQLKERDRQCSIEFGVWIHLQGRIKLASSILSSVHHKCRLLPRRRFLKHATSSCLLIRMRRPARKNQKNLGKLTRKTALQASVAMAQPRLFQKMDTVFQIKLLLFWKYSRVWKGPKAEGHVSAQRN